MAMCTRCSHAHFCSKDCQIAGWKAHKPLCKELQAELEGTPKVLGKRPFCHSIFLEYVLQVRAKLSPLQSSWS